MTLRTLRLGEVAELGPQARGVPDTRPGSPGTALCQPNAGPGLGASHLHSRPPHRPVWVPSPPLRQGLFLTRKALGAVM